MPDFLAITPKPMSPRPPTYVEITDDDTLAWAADQGDLTPGAGSHTHRGGGRDASSATATWPTPPGGDAPRWNPPSNATSWWAAARDDDTTVGGTPDELIDQLRAPGHSRRGHPPDLEPA